MKLRMATRRSALALAQARMVARSLVDKTPGLEIDEVLIVTEGDRMTEGSLARFGGKGLFVSDIEHALLEKRADFAVHSVKDLPARLAPGLVLGAIPEREDARDVLVTAGGLEIDDLPAGATIGTASPRRKAQLRRHRNDLAYGLLRGNVDTRLRRLDEGAFAAIVLAFAGLRRLSLADRPLWPIPIEIAIPAVGQGALGIEVRADDDVVRELVARIDAPASRAMVETERAFLGRLDGGCLAPLAAHARAMGPRLVRVDAMVASLDGETMLTVSDDRYVDKDVAALGSDAADELGNELADRLLSQGAGEILKAARASALDG